MSDSKRPAGLLAGATKPLWGVAYGHDEQEPLDPATPKPVTTDRSTIVE
ncbi:hypothetical protein [Nocardia sp. NPDC003345]